MDRQSGIYKIQSKIHPERIYIGSSVNIKKRIWDHKTNLNALCHKNPKLQCHYNKYGLSDLEFSILVECNKEDLIKQEQFFINNHNPWFNVAKIAGNTLGRTCSEETKKKIGDANRGKKRTSEAIERMRESNLRTDRKGVNNPMYGKHHREEAKKIISEKQLGRKPWNTGTKGLIKSWNKGLTKETSENVCRTGQWRKDPIKLANAKLKLSRWHLGKKLSPESIVKRTATQKLNKEIKLKNTLC